MQLAALEAEEGVSDPSRQLLLWFSRVFYGHSAEDSHEFVLDPAVTGERGLSVDGLVVVQERDVFTISLLKHVKRSGRKGAGSVAATRAEVLSMGSQPMERLKGLAVLDQRLRHTLTPVLAARDVSDVRIVLTLVSMDPITGRTRGNLEVSEAGLDTQVFDGPYLEALAKALVEPQPIQDRVEVPVVPGELLETQAGTNRIVVAPVEGKAIAEWPGISDRRLFDMNVRFALGVNRVRKSLDRALRNSEGQESFLAYHNGLTVLASEVRVEGDRLFARGLSVVNGAQSVIALHANRAHLTPDLRLLVKFVVTRADDPIASNIAIRSNTQNPVTTRNLQALDAVQLRLYQELAELGYVYVTRPDSQRPSGPRVINNDDVAQLLCSVYLERPWLAVKRQLLFDPATYSDIFPSGIQAESVIAAHLIRLAVENSRPHFPTSYLKAWSLTSLTAVFLVGQAMRADPQGRAALTEPDVLPRDPAAAIAFLAPYVQCAVDVLTAHHARRTAIGEDDFKVEFKQQRTLLGLGSEAAKLRRRAERSR